MSVIFVIFCYLVLVFGQEKTSNNFYDILNKIRQGYAEYHSTGIRPGYLNESLSRFQLAHFFRDQKTLPRKIIEDGALCEVCNVAAESLVQERKNGMNNVEIRGEMETLCKLLNIEPGRVCDGFIDINADIILYVIDNNPNFSPGKLCDLLLQNQQCNFTNIDWIVDVPDGQSPIRPGPSDSSSTYKILQVTDVHMDLLYTPGKVRTCTEPLCCQSDQEDGSEGNSCGRWAEYGSDISVDLVDEMLRFANTLDINFVYFTGDIVSHRVWSTSVENNSAVIKLFYDKLQNGFKVPVYSILGNHEPSPLNQFVDDNSVPSSLSSQWLFDLVDQEWSKWLTESQKETIAKGGFYTISPVPGLRLIVLNSNVAYTECWWLLTQDKDPYDQLDWLVSILSQAEAKGESVHILGHIPTGSGDIMKVWGREFNKIVNRFANTITGQFNGHTHVDSFQVYYNISDLSQAINVAWNGASLVAYDNANPSFKVYSVDKDTFNIVDIDQWTFNLTKANENPNNYPEWYKIYSFRDAFGLSTLQPKDMGNLLINMAKNHSQLAEYHLYRYKNSDIAVNTVCDQDCQKGYLCEFSTHVFGETSNCEYLKKIYDQN
ncbi:unnamed protein product [Ceutorhynchus assimilis]|uniref:Sphingomyelin phosphodiesterase n=1 Tax=Ceutorhynchus assimilis TaxID=467358 RepID=A0A9N9MJZ3_9CUCU|nr:unnamed protein product [Ceutorhynchus assimilis]